MEYTVSYPFGKNTFYLRILSSSVALLILVLFIATSVTFLLTPTFIASSALVGLIAFGKNQRTVLDAWDELESRGKHLSKEGRIDRPYRKITAIFFVFAVSFSLILVIPGEIWMGGLLGVTAGYSIADAIFYSYVRRLDKRLGGEIVRLIVTEETGDNNLYVRSGFLLLEW